MIFIYEPWASKSLHIEFNKAFLLSVLSFEKNVTYFGEEQQIKILKSIPGLEGVIYKSVAIPDYEEANSKIHKFMQEFRNLRYVKGEIGNQPLIITNGLPQTLMLSNNIFRQNKLFIVMHGHLSAITGETKYRPWNMGYYVKASLCRINPNFRLIVLGDSIRNNLIRILPKLEKQTYSIEHPFLKKEKILDDDRVYRENGIIKVGTIGVGSESRGLLHLNELASFIEAEKLPIQLFHIGKTSVQIREKLDKSIYLPFMTDKMILEEKYLSEIKKLDYVLYCREENSYQLTASGALFEAFSLGKPVISLRNDYFEYAIKRCEENAGFICDDMEELKVCLKGIIRIEDREYQMLSQGALNALNSFSPEVVGRQLKGILEGR